VSDSPQLSLRYDGASYYEDWWRRVLAELGQVTTVVGLKEMSWTCNAQPSVLANALAERDQRQFQARWLGPFLHKAPDLELAKLIVQPGGAVVQAGRPLTPEEELAALREAIGEVCGPLMLQAINARAKR